MGAEAGPAGRGAAPTVEITLDGERVPVARHRPLIAAAREHGSYVPGWCHHPDMRPAAELEGAATVYRPLDGPSTTPPRGPAAVEGAAGAGEAVRGEADRHEGCGICVVEVDGELARACERRAKAGMEVVTRSEAARERQRRAMAELFRHHPHACLDCPQKEGCDRITCSMNVPEEARCCDLIGSCELEKSAEAVGLDWTEVPRYEPLGRPVQRTPVLEVDWELCIGCARCVGVCEDHVGAGVWRFTRDGGAGGVGGAAVGLKASTLTGSGCKLCTACVAACPTGALTDGGTIGTEESDRERLPLEFRTSLEVVPLPGATLALAAEKIESEVPAGPGVYTLYDAAGDVVAIRGVADLSRGLREEIGHADAVAFDFERDENFTQGETRRIERYVKEHGHMPGAGVMDDLF